MIGPKVLTRRSRALAVGLLSLTGLLALLGNQDVLPVGLTVNRTESIPTGLYWHTTAKVPPAYADQVCFPYRTPAWARERNYLPEGSLICKNVLGLPGDALVRRGDRLEICQGTRCQDAGRVLMTDSLGRPVPAAALPDVIPDGQVYLGAPAVTRSFDSRYLGLIVMSDLKRTIHPLLINDLSLDEHRSQH